jgi:ribosome-associated heat shock protein Hsp15
MSMRQRVDVWLFRARLVKTRSDAARLVTEGGVRLMHQGQTRRLEKPSVEVTPGDALMFAQSGALRAIKIEALPARRGPPDEARALYSDLDAGAVA